jgi:serine protease inhibitor
MRRACLLLFLAACTSADPASNVPPAQTGIEGPQNAPKSLICVREAGAFFFAFRDVPTGAILFTGRVFNPTLTE